MSLAVVLSMLLVLAVASVKGHDSRDGRDWNLPRSVN